MSQPQVTESIRAPKQPQHLTKDEVDLWESNYRKEQMYN